MKSQLGKLATILGISLALVLIFSALPAHGQVTAKPEVKANGSPAPIPPTISADLEIAFANADRDVAAFKVEAADKLKQLEEVRNKAAQAIMDACKPPFVIGKSATGRFTCSAEPPKEAAKK